MNWLLDRCIYCDTRRVWHWIRKGKFNQPRNIAWPNLYDENRLD